MHSLRLFAFLAGLLSFLSWEVIAPHHAPTVPKARRFFTNLVLALLNGAIATVLCATCYAIELSRSAPWRLGVFEQLAVPLWVRLPGEVVALDLLAYWLHRAYHGVPFFWRLHRVHHTDLDLDVSSASRFHFGEVLTSAVAKLGVVVLAGISYPGLISFEVALLLAAQFQHANIRLSPCVEGLFWWTCVPPAMHRVHHSPERRETDSNFGTLLVAWDRLFATLQTHAAEAPPFGLWEWRSARWLSLRHLLWLPFARQTAVASGRPPSPDAVAIDQRVCRMPDPDD
jgi:sterol desaturase/sphingolipid hydroxylase (fatty acid hydroxylase superfamily)